MNNVTKAKFECWYNGPLKITKKIGPNYVIKDKKGHLVTVHKNGTEPFDGSNMSAIMNGKRV